MHGTPKVHQTAKDRQWYFGMMSSVALDRRSKPVHSVLVSAANVADRDALPYLLRGRETRVWGDQGHHGRREVIRRCAPGARDCTNRRYRHGGWVDERIKAKSCKRTLKCDQGFAPAGVDD